MGGYGLTATRATTGVSQPRPRSAMRAIAVHSLLVVGALVTPPMLMLTVGITLGEGVNLWRALWELPVVGAAIRVLMGAIIWIYSLHLQIGAMTPLWFLNGLYLVFAGLFAAAYYGCPRPSC